MTNDQSPARASRLAGGQRALRFLALTAVIIGVLALAAAAFELSYPGIHAIALTAGVSPTLARLYPLIFDAMLVVASAAILSLRGAGVVTRCYAWFSMLLLLGAAAGADAAHATGTRLPHRSAAATVAIIPWALVLLGFGLLLAMLRHARLRRAQAAQARANAAPPARLPAAAVAPAVAGVTLVPVTEVPVTEVQAPERPTRHGRQNDLASRQADSHAPELALDAEPGHDDPTSDEAHSDGHPQDLWVPHARAAEQPAGDSRNAAENPAPIMSPAPTAEVIPGRPAWPELDSEPELNRGPGPELDRGDNAERVPETGPELAGEPGAEDEPEPGMAPVAPFERMWSSPTPPDV
jgi:hypothetical protein